MNIDHYHKYFEPLKFRKGIVDNSINSTISNNTLTKETYELKTKMNPTFRASEAIVQDSKNLTNFSLLLFGSENTPYENCGILFKIHLSNDYPKEPPKLLCTMKNIESEIFHPLIQKNGEICLKILGTTPSKFTAEKWNENNSLYDIVHRLRLLFNSEEPFFTDYNNKIKYNTYEGNVESVKYNQRTKMISIANGIIELLNNPPESFKNIIYIHFIMKKNTILKQLYKWKDEYIDDEYISNEYTMYKERSFNSWINEAINLIKNINYRDV